MKEKITIFWFRRDLRLEDNVGLFHALRDNQNVLPLFIFDRNILDKLENRQDHRVNFIYQRVLELNDILGRFKSGIYGDFDFPIETFKKLLKEYEIKNVYTNRDYEPYAIGRDKEVRSLLQKNGVEFLDFKDQVIFEQDEILNETKAPFKVFTPYSRKWKSKLANQQLETFNCSAFYQNFFKAKNLIFPTLQDMGFEKSKITVPNINFTEKIVKDYTKTRDFPSLNGTTKISTYLRFGLVSVREVVKLALKENETYLNELIWREFYMMILWHFPKSISSNFKPVYEGLNWNNDLENFEKWKNGMTGFPLVDAGMRELNQTGFMHNRLRMITASFLTKNLLIDWKWGEKYFAEKLFDFELASNVGGWQWAASTGVDSVPYFRIFNPDTQIKRFDANFEYIKKWVPEFETSKYVKPIIDYKLSRERALYEFGKIKRSG